MSQGAVADSAYHFNFLALSPTAFKTFQRCCRQHLTVFSDVGDSAKKYKMAISSQNHQLFELFGLVSTSFTHTGLICVKTPEPNISSLGSLLTITFKKRHLICYSPYMLFGKTGYFLHAKT
jgi:hypothetical protein